MANAKSVDHTLDADQAYADFLARTEAAKAAGSTGTGHKPGNLSDKVKETVDAWINDADGGSILRITPSLISTWTATRKGRDATSAKMKEVWTSVDGYVRQHYSADVYVPKQSYGKSDDTFIVLHAGRGSGEAALLAVQQRIIQLELSIDGYKGDNVNFVPQRKAELQDAQSDAATLIRGGARLPATS